jgi:hypothetical protein
MALRREVSRVGAVGRTLLLQSKLVWRGRVDIEISAAEGVVSSTLRRAALVVGSASDLLDAYRLLNGCVNRWTYSAAVFLCAPAASWMTDRCLRADVGPGLAASA